MRWQDRNSNPALVKVKKARGVVDPPPEIDATLTEIILGYQFLCDERTISIGMGGAIPNSIPLSSMLQYYETFPPTVTKKHFVRVVRSADKEYLNIYANKQDKKAKPIPSGKTNANGFPQL